MATFANVLPELAQRGSGAIAEGNGNLRLSDGYRPYPEQVRLYGNYVSYQAAIRRYGSSGAACRSGYVITDSAGRKVLTHDPSPLAAYPGTSDHGKNPATAVDIACRAGFEAERDRICRRWGLKQTVRSEGWHRQLDPNRGPMPTAPTVTATTELPEEDMPAWADQITWPDGTKTQVYPDGSVKGLGEGTFHGSIFDFDPGRTQSFTKAVGLTPHDPYRKEVGYTIWDESGDRWDCPLRPEERRK